MIYGPDYALVVGALAFIAVSCLAWAGLVVWLYTLSRIK